MVAAAHFLLSVGLLVAGRVLLGYAFFCRSAPWTQLSAVANLLTTLCFAPIALTLWDSVLGAGGGTLDNPAVYILLGVNSLCCGSILATIWLWRRRRRIGA